MPNSRPLSSGTRRKTEDGLSAEEARILRHTREEFSRRGGFVRVFPSPDSWELYGLATCAEFFAKTRGFDEKMRTDEKYHAFVWGRGEI